VVRFPAETRYPRLSKTSTLGAWSTQPTIQWIPGVKLTIRFHPVQRLMSGAVTCGLPICLCGMRKDIFTFLHMYVFIMYVIIFGVLVVLAI